MAKKYVVLLVVPACISVVSVILICVSMSTTSWIIGSARSVLGLTYDDSDLNHGLFTGSLTRRLVQTPMTYDIHITCVWTSNACAWSCRSTESERKAEIESILAGESPSFACSTSGRTLDASTISRATNDTISSQFVNAGAWVSSVIFLVLLLIVATLSCLLAVFNIFRSPVEPLLNTLGICIVNAIAVVLNAITLIIYGVHYAVRTQNNVAIRDTLVGEFTSNVSLDYSYWLLLSPCFLHAANVGIVFLRESLMNSEPAETKVDIEDVADGTIVLF